MSETIDKRSTKKKVLITGCAGFIGQSLIPKLVIKGYDVVGIDIIEPEKVKSQKGFNYLKMDLLKPKLMKSELFKDIAWVIHLGGVSSSKLCAKKPDFAYKVNVQGSINLLTILKNYKQAPHVVLASSSEVYGQRDPIAFLREEDELKGNSPYSFTKRAAEETWKYFSSLYNFKWTIFRFSNTFGRKDATEGYIVEYLLECSMKGIDPAIKTPKSINQFMYVDDHLSSYLKLLENPVQGIFNIGGSDYIQIIDLYEKIQGLLRNKEVTNENKDIEAKGIVLNSDKAKGILNWEPKFSLNEGLRDLISKWTKDP